MIIECSRPSFPMDGLNWSEIVIRRLLRSERSLCFEIGKVIVLLGLGQSTLS